MVVDALDPLFGRHQTGFFARQVDTGAPAQAQSGAVLMNHIDSKPLPKGIEKNVAGLHDGRVEIDDAMSRRPPAVKRSAVKISVPRTIRGETLRDALGLKHRRGHDNFEN